MYWLFYDRCQRSGNKCVVLAAAIVRRCVSVCVALVFILKSIERAAGDRFPGNKYVIYRLRHVACSNQISRRLPHKMPLFSSITSKHSTSRCKVRIDGSITPALTFVFVWNWSIGLDTWKITSLLELRNYRGEHVCPHASVKLCVVELRNGCLRVPQQ